MPDEPATPVRRMNVFEVEQTQSKFTMKAEVSDDLGGQISRALGMILTKANRFERNIESGSTGFDPNRVFPALTMEPEEEGENDPEINSLQVEDDSEIGHRNDESPVTDSDKLNQIFKFEDHGVSLFETRLKAESINEQARRISTLYVYACDLIYGKHANKADILNLLEHGNANTSNTRFMLSRIEHFDCQGDDFRLMASGVDYAKRILSEIFDDSITTNWIPGSGSRRRRQTKSAKKADVISEKRGSPADGSAPENPTSTNKTPTKVIRQLISSGFFSEPKTVADIVRHSKHDYAITLKRADVSRAMARLVQSGSINRSQRADKKYEYYA